MAKKSALVILGAGASFDCLAYRQPPQKPQYRPPLTDHIFDPSKCSVAEQHLSAYPGAQRLAATIRNRIKDDPGRLEPLLRDLRDSRESPYREDFPHIRLFLQELFGEVSSEYVTDAGNYSDLVARLFTGGFRRVAFVTLNYDRLLEKSLGTPAWGGPFRSMSSYLRNRWLVVKLHGSVDWVRRLEAPPIRPEDAPRSLEQKRAKILDIVDKNGIEYADLPAIVVPTWDSWFMEDTRFPLQENRPLFAHYPVIAVPAEGKYEPMCPREHVVTAQEWASECRNVLILGASGRDQDLFEEILSHLPDVALCHVVGQPADAAHEAAENFRQNVPQLQSSIMNVGFEAFTNGFSHYLTEQGLNSFINEAVA